MAQEAPISAGYSLASSESLLDCWFLGGRAMIKVTGERSGGRVAQVEVQNQYGFAPPWHTHHREDETMFVLDGEITVFVGEAQFTASKGGLAYLPQNIKHTYVVRSQQARLLVTIAPAGFERFYSDIGVPVVPNEPEPPPLIPDPVTFAKRAAMYGIEIVGPPPAIEASI
jgi:quercetin dioxygenase-like cupin family protein